MGWGWILLLVLIFPFAILWPLLIWGGAIISLHQLIRDKVWRRVMVHQKRTMETAKEPLVRKRV